MFFAKPLGKIVTPARILAAFVRRKTPPPPEAPEPKEEPPKKV